MFVSWEWQHVTDMIGEEREVSPLLDGQPRQFVRSCSYSIYCTSLRFGAKYYMCNFWLDRWLRCVCCASYLYVRQHTIFRHLGEAI